MELALLAASGQCVVCFRSNERIFGRTLATAHFRADNSRLFAERSYLSYRAGFRHTPRLDHTLAFIDAPPFAAMTRQLEHGPLLFNCLGPTRRLQTVRMLNAKKRPTATAVKLEHLCILVPSLMADSWRWDLRAIKHNPERAIPPIPMSHANCDGNCENDPTRPLRLSQGHA